ncbi:MAG: FAD:protein FMN transferase [Deltaproteobacteria bacterium]|nr:FAD:protein FMN transferase [Deltaproteobacteria bacterium]
MDCLNRISEDEHPMGRRAFLKLSGLLGLGVASAWVIPGRAEAVKFDRNTHKVSETRLAMGTFVSMTLIHTSRDQAEEAMGRAFEEIERLTKLMNRFDSSTAVGHLNQEGRIQDLPPEVVHVIENALLYNRRTGGAFDITVKPVVDLFRERMGGEKKALPTDRELKNLLQLIGSQKVELHGNSISFAAPGMGITLDGIAKGYIVDKASEVLARHRVENHLINGGGDIRTMGEKGDHKPWTIAIQDPWKKRDFPDRIALKNGAVATSGNYEVYYDREKMFHHIVDPATGHSPRVAASTSVLAPSAMQADALATGVFVMSPARGTEFINSLPDCASLIIDGKGNQIKSGAWKSTPA